MNAISIVSKTTLGAAILLLASIAPPLAPKPPYAADWAALYPSSPSSPSCMDNVANGMGSSCQLCHGDASGGDNYNGYGWAIKQFVDAGQSRSAAIALAEGADSDGDSGGFTNLAEINSSAQPGWTAGATNTIYFDNGSTTTNQMPPAGILIPMDSLSYPTIQHNGTGVNPVVLTDTGGDPSLSPRLNMATEPFGVTLNCSSAPASGVYAIQIRLGLATTPPLTQFGELLFQGPTIYKSTGFHNSAPVIIGPIVLPYDTSLLNVTYYVQGFCGSSIGGSFLSNALEQRVGI
jgi:hypothetical protein